MSDHAKKDGGMAICVREVTALWVPKFPVGGDFGRKPVGPSTVRASLVPWLP